MGFPQLKQCKQCQELKPHKAFQRYKVKARPGKSYLRTKCKECYKEYRKTLPPSIASVDLYGETIVCIKCNKEKPKTDFLWNTTSGYINKKCKPCFAETNNLRERSQQHRKDCIQAYGGKCRCCGEAEVSFLTFDHVNDDGAEHRTKVSPGYSMYVWLKKNNFPNTIQILCWNCNYAKRLGICPHKLNVVKDG